MDTRKTVRVLEPAPDLADVAEGNHGVALESDGHGDDVGKRFEQARHLYGEPALARVLCAGRDQLVGGLDKLHRINWRQVVAFQLDGIDEDFQKLLAVTGDLRR